MDIKDIIKSYGLNDYYEMSSARIFKISQAKYNKETNKTSIPVTRDGDFLGTIEIDGDIKEII